MASEEEELRIEVENLTSRLKCTEVKLQSTEEKLEMAATFGKQLIDENTKLNSQLETGCISHVNKIEELEQEKHSLQLELECLRMTERDSHNELEDIRNTLQKEKAEAEERLRADHQIALSQMKKEISSLQADLDAAKAGQEQAEDKNKQSEEMVRELQNQLLQRTTFLNETNSEEMASMQSELSLAQNAKTELMQKMNEQSNVVSQLKAEKSSMQTQLRLKQEEVEEAQCEATSYCNLLQRARDENQELRVELDLLKMESQDQKAKGNSLFSEVEDRRVKVEKEIISYKVKNEAMVKQLEISYQQIAKLKKQVSGLLLSSRGEADRNYIESLQSQLNQARFEVRELNQLKNRPQATDEKDSTKGLGEKFFKQFQNPNEKDYIGFLETLLDKEKEETAKVKRSLEEKAMYLILESEKVLKSERENFVLEKANEKLRAQLTKQKMNYEELQLKYEPEKYQEKNKPPKRVTEVLNFAKPAEGNSESANGKSADPSTGPPTKVILKEIRPGQTEPTDAFAKDTKPDEGAMEKLKEKAEASKSLRNDLLSKRNETDAISDASVPKWKKTKKTVSMSDDVNVIEYVPEKSEEEPPASDNPGRGRGRKRYHNVIKVSEQKPEIECNQQ